MTLASNRLRADGHLEVHLEAGWTHDPYECGCIKGGVPCADPPCDRTDDCTAHLDWRRERLTRGIKEADK